MIKGCVQAAEITLSKSALDELRFCEDCDINIVFGYSSIWSFKLIWKWFANVRIINE